MSEDHLEEVFEDPEIEDPKPVCQPPKTPEKIPVEVPEIKKSDLLSEKHKVCPKPPKLPPTKEPTKEETENFNSKMLDRKLKSKSNCPVPRFTTKPRPAEDMPSCGKTSGPVNVKCPPKSVNKCPPKPSSLNKWEDIGAEPSKVKNYSKFDEAPPKPKGNCPPIGKCPPKPTFSFEKQPNCPPESKSPIKPVNNSVKPKPRSRSNESYKTSPSMNYVGKQNKKAPCGPTNTKVFTFSKVPPNDKAVPFKPNCNRNTLNPKEVNVRPKTFVQKKSVFSSHNPQKCSPKVVCPPKKTKAKPPKPQSISWNQVKAVQSYKKNNKAEKKEDCEFSTKDVNKIIREAKEKARTQPKHVKSLKPPSKCTESQIVQPRVKRTRSCVVPKVVSKEDDKRAKDRLYKELTKMILQPEPEKEACTPQQVYKKSKQAKVKSKYEEMKQLLFKDIPEVCERKISKNVDVEETTFVVKEESLIHTFMESPKPYRLPKLDPPTVEGKLKLTTVSLDQEDVEEAVVCDEEISGWAQHLQDYGVSIEDIARENALVSKNLVVESCSFEEKDLIDEDLTGWQLTSKESRGVQFVQEEDEVEIEQFEDVEIEEFQDVEIEQFGDVERKTFEENEVEQIEGVSSEDFELNECNYVEEVNMGGNSAETFTNMVSFKSLKAKLEECSFENEGLNRVSEWNQISCESQEEILPGCNKKPVNKSISNESLNGKKILRCPIVSLFIYSLLKFNCCTYQITLK